MNKKLKKHLKVFSYINIIMFSVSTTKKFLNQTNALLTESNHLVVDRFVELLLEKFDNIDKSELEQVAFTLKDEVSEEHLSNVLQKKKKKNGVKRAPTEYNLFVKEQMQKLKEDSPDLKNKELMAKAASLWQEHKESKLQMGEQKVV